MAQVPQKISYQAVVRNSSNALIVNQTIGLRVSIIQGNILGTAVYVERQSPVSNASGVISIQIGNNPLGLSFSTINWINGPFYLKTEIDPTGGNNYTINGISELLSVPYSLYAQNAYTVNGLVAVINGGTGAKSSTLARVNLGLGNVDNIRDVDKPISKKVQSALNSKANLEDPLFKGIPEAPTANVGTNTNQIANTIFVNDAILRATTTPDATATVKGILKLNGDLTGNANSPLVANGAINNLKVANDADIADTKLANISSPGKVANSATTATNTNSNNTIVARDASGNFSANIITSNLDGNASGTAENVTGIVLGANGGTGIENTGKTITLGGNLTTAGAFAITLESTDATNVTLPTSGILATRDGTETFTNKTIAAGTNTISGLTNDNLSGFAGIADSNLATIATPGKVANSATTATNTNSINTIVARDASGNFSADTITASIKGNATNVSGVVAIENGGTGASTVVDAKMNFILDKVNNTTDLNKPISTATLNALILKAPLVSPVFTGIPIAPTAALATRTPQIATTEFVMANASTPDATNNTKGKIKLAGDLAGTADNPVVALNAIDNSKISITAEIADTKLATISTPNKVANSATTATDTNSINTIVARDAFGNFFANTITATLTGNISGTAENVTGIVLGANGGTGIDNSGKTISLSGNLTTAGTYNTTLTSTGPTNVILPKTGTLATLTGVETFTNKTIAAGTNTISGLTNNNLSNTAGITANKLASNSVTETKIAADAVTETKIADDAVTETKIAIDAVTQFKIASNSISEDKIQNDAVTSYKIEDGAITENKIADDAVTTDKIEDGAITGNKIRLSNVLFEHIQNVNPNKILGRKGGVGIIQELATSGTGNVVLSQNPKLTNPDLGTPIAIDLTYAKSIPLSKNNVNGILSVENGGTGSDSLSGLVKGEGKSRFKSAQEGADYSLVREVEDVISATTTDESSFFLTYTPNAKSIVKMFINGIKVLNNSISVNGTNVTYTKALNRGIQIEIGNTVEFVYYY